MMKKKSIAEKHESEIKQKKPTLLMNLSCSSACLTIFTACLDKTSLIFSQNKTNPYHKIRKQIQPCIEIKLKKRKAQNLSRHLNKFLYTILQSAIKSNSPTIPKEHESKFH